MVGRQLLLFVVLAVPGGDGLPFSPWRPSRGDSGHAADGVTREEAQAKARARARARARASTAGEEDTLSHAVTEANGGALARTKSEQLEPYRYPGYVSSTAK